MTEIAIAATIFNEARGESSAGRQAVKAVIQNREAYTCPKKGCGRNHNLAEWRNSTIFHGYATARPNVPAAEEAIWQECVNLASRRVPDNTGGATHFQRGGFGAGFQSTTTIGLHKFAREITETTRHS
jgi:hypothetical protein